jgi:hypothetical protein
MLPGMMPPVRRPGAHGRTARDGGIGSTTGAGICHAYTPDGRCVSLSKILLTNFCRYDCAYCVGYGRERAGAPSGIGHARTWADDVRLTQRLRDRAPVVPAARAGTGSPGRGI